MRKAWWSGVAPAGCLETRSILSARGGKKRKARSIGCYVMLQHSMISPGPTRARYWVRAGRVYCYWELLAVAAIWFIGVVRGNGEQRGWWWFVRSIWCWQRALTGDVGSFSRPLWKWCQTTVRCYRSHVVHRLLRLPHKAVNKNCFMTLEKMYMELIVLPKSSVYRA